MNTHDTVTIPRGTRIQATVIQGHNALNYRPAEVCTTMTVPRRKAMGPIAIGYVVNVDRNHKHEAWIVPEKVIDA